MEILWMVMSLLVMFWLILMSKNKQTHFTSKRAYLLTDFALCWWGGRHLGDHLLHKIDTLLFILRKQKPLLKWLHFMQDIQYNFHACSLSIRYMNAHFLGQILNVSTAALKTLVNYSNIKYLLKDISVYSSTSWVL